MTDARPDLQHDLPSADDPRFSPAEATGGTPVQSPQPEPAQAAVPGPTEPQPAVEVRSLEFRYPGGPPVLEEISFSLQRGETLGLVGPSGAGKSTLLHHLNGLLPDPLPCRKPADDCPVRVGGQSVCRESLPEIRRAVGLLFQDPDDQLFCPTVREDVAFGPLNLGLRGSELDRRVGDSLAAVGLEGFGERSTLQLSIGERKRVCLAGVLACQPQVLALDEPFSNLDPRARRQLLTALKKFDGGLIMATHQLNLVVQHCDRVILLDGGRLITSGPPAVVLSDPILMERHGLEVPLVLQLPPGSRPM